MAYFAPYMDDAGLHVPTYNDIRDDLLAKFREIYGNDLYLGNDSQDYQMISAFALKTYDTIQLLQIVYNNHSPKTAVGTGLSSLVKLNGIRRKAASYSTCVLTLTGKPGTVIAAGVAEDDQRRKWELPQSIKFESESLEVTARCRDIGAIEAPVGTITKISNPQYGWISATNKVPAVKGRPIETDEELRRRQAISVALPSRNMLDGTIAGITSVSGVRRCKVYDNDSNVTDANGIPGHSIAAVVEGGLDSEIAKQIYLRKGPGGGTYGTTTMTYVNADGLENKVSFFRPSYIKIDVTVTIRRNPTYSTNVSGDIQRNIEDYIRSLYIGAVVSVTGLLTAIMSVVTDNKNPSFSLNSVQVGKSGETMGVADVVVAFNEVADVGCVKVEVVG